MKNQDTMKIGQVEEQEKLDKLNALFKMFGIQLLARRCTSLYDVNIRYAITQQGTPPSSVQPVATCSNIDDLELKVNTLVSEEQAKQWIEEPKQP